MLVSNSSVAAVPPPFALAASLLPLLPLQLMLGACLREICDRHPHIFDRLGPYGGKRFEPTDLPIAFVLEPRRTNPQVRAVRTLPHGIDARIAGPLAALIGMVEG